MALDGKLVATIAEERHRLLVTGVRVIVFLFTTITILAITISGATGESLSFLGVTIADEDAFIFSGFMVGNVLYVVCTGLFVKVFVCEFLILNIISSKGFLENRCYESFLRSFHANALSALLIFDAIPRHFQFTRGYLSVVNVYAKYYVLIFYGVYYYGTLAYFLVDLFERRELAYFSVLVVANVFSAFTSYAVFFFVPTSMLQRVDLPSAPTEDCGQDNLPAADS